ncbi:amidohydrolase [Candidatus Bathyarchaeota archaeon]|nr:MAG: amidohydrolase [Candidatus Bathyarchaeota archaeon]
MSSEKEYAISWIDSNRDRIVKISDEIWRFAELGLLEHKSSSLLISELEKHGFRVEREVASMPTAFIASYGNSKPVIAVLGEYDALPGLSQKKIPRKEPVEPGKPGHGCGHNIYGASGVAAAIATRYAMEKYGIKGTIRFYGCPAEENLSGKVFMVRDGCFRDVDAVIGHHPGTMNGADLKSTLALNSVKFHFYGKSAHAGGSPDQGRSALDAVEIMDVGVNFLREHVIQDARIHYIIDSGGNQPNIVPDYARSWYYVRAPEREQVEFIYRWILDIAEGAAKMTRTRVKHEFIGGLYNMIPNRVLSEIIVKNMRAIGPPKYSDEEIEFGEEIAKSIPREMKIEALRRSKRPRWERLVDKLIDDEVPDPWGEGEVSHGSTDVADVSWQAPTVEFSTAAWILGTPAHSWQAVAQSGVGLGHKSLIFAAKTAAASIIDLMTDEDLLKNVKREHEERLRGRRYKSPMPLDMKPPLDFWEKAK